MKKFFLIVTWFALSSFVFADVPDIVIDGELYPLIENVTIQVNGDKQDFEEPPYILKNRTIVPLKFLMDTLGYEVLWDQETKTVTSFRGAHKMVLQINNPVMTIDGEEYVSDMIPIVINNRTYVPLAIIARATGAEVLWDGPTSTVDVNEKLETLNLYYGRSAYKNYLSYDIENTINQIAYAWSKVELENGTVELNISSKNDNQMYIPEGYELVAKNGSCFLNIYADKDYDFIFNQQETLIQEIKQLILTPNSDQPMFDGVVVDFENLKLDDYEKFTDFIIDLKSELGNNKLLHVALQPRDFDYSTLIQHVDGMILMLHDYESKLDTIVGFPNEFAIQPLTPFDAVKEDLLKVVSEMTVHEKSKILLQLNLSVVQWQGPNKFQLTRYTPGYNKLIERLKVLDESSFHYDETYQNPYVTYVDESNNYNTIWYENEQSLQAKIDLVKLYDLGGLSLWQLGNLPKDATQEFELNIWEQILENY